MDQDGAHILVVDDDTRLRDLLRQYLSDNGYRITTADSAEAAQQFCRSIAFDLIVLDRMMPGDDGLSFARELRAGDRVPILMLTAMGEVKDRIDGLEVGVDDYLPKPFEPRELLLRIQIILRRVETADEAVAAPPLQMEIALGDFRFDVARALLSGADGAVKLTSAEASLLTALAQRPGEVMSRLDLTEICDIEGGERSIDVQVTRIRRKVEPDPKTPRYLQTVRGRGYVLRPD